MVVNEELEEFGVITKARDAVKGRCSVVTKAMGVAEGEELKEIGVITKARDKAVGEELEELGVITKARDVPID